MAGAPKGNSNATKWKLNNAQELINDVSEYITNREDCFSIAYACTVLGYYETLLYYFKEKFEDIDFEPIKKAKDTIKARLINQGVKGETNATMSIFVLKNNHGMKDKQEVQQTVENITPISEEEIQEAKDKLNGEI